MPERRDHLQTLERGLVVIAAFTGRGPLLSLTEVTAATGLGKPTVRRILLTLEGLGYARAVEGRFGLTPKVLALGYAYLSSVRLTDVARPRMEALTDQLGVSTSLASLDGADVVYIDRVQRGRITSINLAAGTRLPAYATSMGHVLLSYAAKPDVDFVLALAPFPALTDRTITDARVLLERLDQVRARGWDVVDQELEIGRRSAAAPVFDNEGRAIAALSLSCGTLQCSTDDVTETMLPALVETARAISDALGASVRGLS
jgi:IclR family pca regulon transcriptional regulator